MIPSRLLRSTTHHLVARRRLALGLGLACLAAALLWPRASEGAFGLAPGDVTLAVRFAWMALASGGLLRWASETGRRAVGLWLAAMAPPAMFLPGFPALLAPIALVPWYHAQIGARSTREAALVGGCAAGTTVIGASGWIFHYFDRPFLPALIALAVAWALWAPLAVVTRAAVRRSASWAPAVAGLLPLTEIARSEWLDPPLPGLLMAHANASTALVRLAPVLGEPGLAWIVATFGLAGAVLLRSQPARLPVAATMALLLLVGATLARLGPAEGGAGPESERVRVCSVQDPLRTGGEEAFGGGGDAAIFGLAARAEELGCRIVAFPEYSLRLGPQQLVPGDWGLDTLGRGMVVIAGASVEDGVGSQRRLRNVVCRLHLGSAKQINCAGALDKLVFAPFGEVGLFQDSPLLAGIGAWLSLQATGSKFSRLTSLQPVGLLPLGRSGRSGVAICWEILVPNIFERRGVPGRGSVELLAVVSDLDGFGGSTVAIDHLRRAAALHAVRLGAPLLFASTNDPFLMAPSGRALEPVAADAFVTAWEIALPGATQGRSGV